MVPVAKKIPKTFDNFGEKRVDDYYWLREKTNPDTIAYLNAENTYTDAAMAPHAALRETKSPAKEMGLLEPDVSEATILGAMLEHPILVNRPIVATPKGVRLCRPSEAVLDLLDRLPKGPFYKEDGQILIDETGVRIA